MLLKLKDATGQEYSHVFNPGQEVQSVVQVASQVFGLPEHQVVLYFRTFKLDPKWLLRDVNPSDVDASELVVYVRKGESTAGEVQAAIVKNLLAMGFKYEQIQKALKHVKAPTEETVLEYLIAQDNPEPPPPSPKRAAPPSPKPEPEPEGRRRRQPLPSGPLEQLVNMGFDRAIAECALDMARGDANRAVDLIMDGKVEL